MQLGNKKESKKGRDAEWWIQRAMQRERGGKEIDAEGESVIVRG